ncbi:hypothetical protein RJ641_030921 [Dillenia turbinata]|uniref:Uncharacterized protein n=1 Tax=Dillenia turbinata TaxID=194707 RepID=A0AAN8ZKG0_9MAGN
MGLLGLGTNHAKLDQAARSDFRNPGKTRGENMRRLSESDQSISDEDEDDFHRDWNENCVALSEKKYFGIDIQSQLENLREKDDYPHNWHDSCIPSSEKVSGKIPLCVDENVGCSSKSATYQKAHKIWKGGRGKFKPQFSFRLHLQSEENCLQTLPHAQETCSKVQQAAEKHGHEFMDPSVAENSLERKRIQSDASKVSAAIVPPGNGCTKHSMVELLNNIQENSILLEGNSKMCNGSKGKSVQLGAKHNLSYLGDRNLSSEVPTEYMSSEPSSGDEAVKPSIQANDQNPKPAFQDIRRQNMASLFQEALDASSLTEELFLEAPKLLGCGLFQQLQQVMQRERERDLHFMKKSQTHDIVKDEASYLDVKILSKYLDAKLTVCRCTLDEITVIIHDASDQV